MVSKPILESSMVAIGEKSVVSTPKTVNSLVFNSPGAVLFLLNWAFSILTLGALIEIPSSFVLLVELERIPVTNKKISSVSTPKIFKLPAFPCSGVPKSNKVFSTATLGDIRVISPPSPFSPPLAVIVVPEKMILSAIRLMEPPPSSEEKLVSKLLPSRK